MEIVLLPRLKSVLTLCPLVSFEHGGSVSDKFLYGLEVFKNVKFLNVSWKPVARWRRQTQIGAPTKGNVGKK